MMRAYEVREFGIDNLAAVEQDEPRPAAGQVVVRIRAASLNYRDLMFVKGAYNPRARLPAVPLSDGAGEVTAVGEGVTRWKTGDRVCPIFTQGWYEGPPTLQKNRTALGGGDLAGVLREYGAFDERGLVAIPEHLSFEEAACLPCAGVTAWNALVNSGNLKAGQTVLTLGTGGVSIFAVQFALMHGAHVIVTSSSDEKLERVKAMGAVELINYRSTPDWEREVLQLTGRMGVDHVIEVGGAGTLERSIACARVGGHIALIGVLAGAGGFDPRPLLMRSIRLQGIMVGSRLMFEQMNAAVSSSWMRPVVDRVFDFEEIRDALRYMESGSHFGKIVVKF